MTGPDVITWDWREQIPLGALARILAAHGVHLVQVDSHTDEYAVVISRDPLTAEQAQAVYDTRED